MVFGVDGTGDDSKLNSCGVHVSHAYSVIKLFELKSGNKTDHKMLMIKNPR
jgi:hypothetical protein